MVVFQYCPQCRTDLYLNADGLQACPQDDFVHWDNPIPVAAVLVPFSTKAVQQENGSWFPYATPNDSRILLVQRGIPPFPGQWCLPCGYINKKEHPKAAATRETHEESGIDVRLEQLLCYCNPAPGEANHAVVHYLGRPVGGIIHPGDDAKDCRLFAPNELPDICFRSHRKVINEWFHGDYGSITGKDLLR